LVNHDRLSAFIAFSDQLNFTHTAKKLHISQPALHVQIKKLSEEIGRPLYRREGKALTLTEEGKRLAAFGREFAERSRAMLEELRGEATSGPVILASGQGAFLYLLGPAIRRFPKERWPLRLVSMSAPEAMQAVRDAKAHLAVVAIERPSADLTRTPLLSVGQKVVLPRSHRLAKRRSLRPTDLRREPLVLAPAGSPHRTMLEQAFRTMKCELNIAVEATGWELMLQFARCGMGATIVNDFCPHPQGMVAIPLRDVPNVTFSSIERHGMTNEGAKQMRALILETLRPHGSH
jgi:DNA-binding transcriptional LysR family regulator